MISLEWYDDDETDGNDDGEGDECTDDGDEGEAKEEDELTESSIKFSDFAKSMTRASRVSQFTGVDSSVGLSLKELSAKLFLRKTI